MKYVVLVIGFLVMVVVAAAQEDFTAVHRDDFERWSRVTEIPAAQIERMWKQTSHYANAADDDSSIDLVDVRALRARDQILMVTTAGIPRPECGRVLQTICDFSEAVAGGPGTGRKRLL